jgi:hypothetical protein
MTNLFKVGQTVIFKSPINAAITTKVIDLKYSELSKTYLYTLECRKGVFCSVSCILKVPSTLKNEDRYSLEKIDRIIDEENQMFYDRGY